MRDEYYFSAEERGWRPALRDALQDLGAGLRRADFWLYMGLREFHAGTRKTVLGNAWTLIAFLFKVVCLGYVYASMLSNERSHMFVYIAAGLALWDFLSTVIAGGVSVFAANASALRERNDPISIVVYQTLVRLGAQLGVRLLGFAMIAVGLGTGVSPIQLLAIPGLALYFVAAFPVTLLIGCLGTRYRDLGQAIQPLMILLFLVTPVLWEPHAIGNAQWVTLFNPLTHFLALVRDPLLGQLPSLLSIGITCGFTAVCWVLAVVTFARVKNFLVFWV